MTLDSYLSPIRLWVLVNIIASPSPRVQVLATQLLRVVRTGKYVSAVVMGNDTSALVGSSKFLKLSDAAKLLETDYLWLESGCGLTEDNMFHVAAQTYMPGVTAAMIDWWFGFIHTTDQYKLWHPRDHVWSSWEGPRDNKSEYIGGHHLVHEYIGGDLQKLKISFKSPAVYFGPDFQAQFQKYNYGTAVCGRVGLWNQEANTVTYMGHLIHLVKNEPDGCRMRSRFWLGDVEGAPAPVGNVLPSSMTYGLLKHASEEMSILAGKLPDLYQQYARREGSGKADTGASVL